MVSSIGRGVGPLFALAFLQRAVDWSSWTVILLVAFEAGGASEAGVAVAVQLLPAALAAPLVTAAGDRFDRRRVIAVANAVQCVVALGVAGVLMADGPLLAVYGLAAAFTLATLAVPAAHESLMVQHARTPSELVSWNVTSALVRQIGTLVGPALVAVLLTVVDPGEIFVVIAAGAGLGVLIALFLLPTDDRVAGGPNDDGSELSAVGGVFTEAWHGIREAVVDGGQRRVIGYMSTIEALASAVEVFLVAVAIDQLSRESDAGAVLLAVVAGGAIAGSIALAAMGRRVSLAHLALVGAALMAVPLVLMPSTATFVVVALLAAVIGIGIAAAEVSSTSILQRVTPETSTSRAFGASYSAEFVAGAVGALAAGWLIDSAGLDRALVTVGLVGGASMIALAVALRPVEDHAVRADPIVVERLRSIPFFTPLPFPTLERLATSMETRHHDGQTVLIVEGDIGEEFFVLIDGEVEIACDGEIVGRAGAPDFFGEVALWRDEPRNATLTTLGPVEVGVIDRTSFLESVTRSHSGRLEADAIARARSG